MSKQKDVLQRLKTALARSEGNAVKEHPPWRGPSVLSRRNEAKRVLLRGAIAEIERLRAIVSTPLLQTQATIAPTIGVAWAEASSTHVAKPA